MRLWSLSAALCLLPSLAWADQAFSPPGLRSGGSGDVSGMTRRARGANADRTQADSSGDRANVLDFAGALPAQFAAACASLPSTGGTIYIPGRTYTVSGALVCADKPVSVIGDGPGVTVLNFTSATTGAAGMSLSVPYSKPASVANLSLITLVDQVNGNIGLSIAYPAAASNTFKGPQVDNVEVAGTGNNQFYWAKGIELTNAWNFVIASSHVRGQDFGAVTAFPAAAMGAAVSIVRTGGGGCADGKITGTTVTFARYGGRVDGPCEGLHWRDFTAIAVDGGISYSGSAAAPGFFVADNHINSFSFGVDFAGALQGTVHDNLFYKWANSAQDWVGVALRSYNDGSTTFPANDNIIHDNLFYGFAGATPGGTATGVSAIGVDGNIISRNKFVRTNWPVDFGGSTSANTFADNTATATVNKWQKATGTNTITRNNTPVATGTDTDFVGIPAGATTFNVGQWVQRLFLTTNSGAATTITDLTGAESGRQITIFAQDANTTIANNSRISLKGQTSATLVLYGSITLLYKGSQWQEIGRSQ